MTPPAPSGVGSIVRRVGFDVGVDVVGGGIVGFLAGVAAAVFVAGLAGVTALREASASVFVPLLPVAAAALLTLLARLDPRVGGGTTVVLDTAHRGGPAIPAGLGVVALLGTWWTHLWGGSAGREGTAVQMGASLADFVAQRLGLTAARRHEMLVAGVAGGFGSVFGTPLAGAVFALEFVRARQVSLRAAVPAVVAAVSGDVLAQRLGVTHAHYTQVEVAS